MSERRELWISYRPVETWPRVPGYVYTVHETPKEGSDRVRFREVLPGDAIPQPLVDADGRPLTQGAVNHLLVELETRTLQQKVQLDNAKLVEAAREFTDWGVPELPGASQSQEKGFQKDWRALREALNDD